MNESDKGKQQNADNSQTNNQKTMNNNCNSQNNNNQTGGMNVPDWVMHLLSGAGSMGGSYLLFIKPLQEKFDELQKQITAQKETIDDLQTQIKQLMRKQGNKSLSGMGKESAKVSYSDYMRKKKQQEAIGDCEEGEEEDEDDEEQSGKSQKNFGLFSLKNKSSFQNQSSNKGNVRF